MATPSPPVHKMDGSFSWFVLALSTTSAFLSNSLVSSAGMIQADIVSDLDIATGPIAIMTSVALSSSCLLGPLSGILINILSARVTIMAGVLLCSTGLVGASLSQSLPTMTVFYGLVMGVGYGIHYTPLVLVVTYHFEKHRILANGIILCSSGLSQLSLPYLHQYLLDEYGWRVCMMVLAGSILQIFIMASFFRPSSIERKTMLPFIRDCLEAKPSRKSVNNNNNESYTYNPNLEMNITDSHFSIQNTGTQEGPETTSMLQESKEIVKIDNEGVLQTEKENESVHLNGSTSCIRNGFSVSKQSVQIAKEKDDVLNHSCKTKEDDSIKNNTILKTTGNSSNRAGYKDEIVQISFENPQKEIVFDSERLRTSSVSSNRSGSNCKVHNDVVKLVQSEKGTRSPSSNRSKHLSSSLIFASSEFGSSVMVSAALKDRTTPNDTDMSTHSIEKKTHSIKKDIKRLCRSKIVWLLCFNAFFLLFGHGINSIHFPAFVKSKGLDKNIVPQALTFYGISMLISRLGGGFLYNRLQPPLVILMFCLQVLNGLVLALSPFYAASAIGMYFLQAAVGFTYGQCYMLYTPILAQLMGVRDISISYGIVQLFVGLGYLFAPIMAGFVYDATGSFQIPLHIGGCIVIFGALMLVFLKILTRNQKSTMEVEGEENIQIHYDEADQRSDPLLVTQEEKSPH